MNCPELCGLGIGMCLNCNGNVRVIPPVAGVIVGEDDERIGIRAVSIHTIPGTDHRAVLAERGAANPDIKPPGTGR